MTAADAARGELTLPEILAAIVPTKVPVTGTKGEQPQGKAAKDVSGTFVAEQIVEPPPPAKQAEDVAPAKNVTLAKTIHGIVVDDKGKPIAGADVWNALVWDMEHERSATHVTSDAEGRFIVPVGPLPQRDSHAPSYGPISLWAWAYTTGHQLGAKLSGNQIFGLDKSDVVIRLGPAVETPFVVLGPDGQPREGALVEPDGYGEVGLPKECDRVLQPVPMPKGESSSRRCGAVNLIRSASSPKTWGFRRNDWARRLLRKQGRGAV